MLEAHCEQYQKAKERGHTYLASITATTSSLHLDAITKSKLCCNKCGYSHPNGKCQQCYACGGYNHYTALCQQRGCRQNKQCRGFKPSKCSYSHGCHSSHSPCRYGCKGHSSHSHSRTPSHSPSCSPTVAHHLGTPHIPKGTLHPTGTTRMLYMSFQLTASQTANKQHPKGTLHPTGTTRMLYMSFTLTASQLATEMKVSCTQRVLQMAK